MLHNKQFNRSVYFLNLNDIQPEELKFWIKDFVAMFLIPVKAFQQFNFGENIIYSEAIRQNNLYWSYVASGSNPL